MLRHGQFYNPGTGSGLDPKSVAGVMALPLPEQVSYLKSLREMCLAEYDRIHSKLVAALLQHAAASSSPNVTLKDLNTGPIKIFLLVELALIVVGLAVHFSFGENAGLIFLFPASMGLIVIVGFGIAFGRSYIESRWLGWLRRSGKC